MSPIIQSLLLALAFTLTLSKAPAQSPCTWHEKTFGFDEWNEISAHPTVAMAALEKYKTSCPDAVGKVDELIGYLRQGMTAHRDSAEVRRAAWESHDWPWACPTARESAMDRWTVIANQGKYAFLPSDGQLKRGFDFDWAEDFGNGLGLVTMQGKSYFHDHSGQTFQAAFAVEDIVEATRAVFLSGRLPFENAVVQKPAPQVKILIMDAERMPSLNLGIEMFPNLETLVIQSLKARDIGQEKNPPITVPIFPGLRRLVLARVKPLNLDHALAGMPHIQSLTLMRPHLLHLPLEIGHLHDLEELSVENYGLGRLPGSFSELRQLRRLSLFRCGMKEFPTAILQLDSLEVLDLSENQFQEVPEAVGNLKGLRELRFRWCAIEKISAQCLALPALEVLDLSENVLHGLPEGLPVMPALRKLDLHNGFNGRFVASPALFPNLCWLNLSSNYDELSPESLAEMKQVKVLDLSDAELETLPKTLREMPGLNHLILKKNPCSDTREKREAIRKQMHHWLPDCKVYLD